MYDHIFRREKYFIFVILKYILMCFRFVLQSIHNLKLAVKVLGKSWISPFSD